MDGVMSVNGDDSERYCAMSLCGGIHVTSASNKTGPLLSHNALHVLFQDAQIKSNILDGYKAHKYLLCLQGSISAKFMSGVFSNNEYDPREEASNSVRALMAVHESAKLQCLNCSFIGNDGAGVLNVLGDALISQSNISGNSRSGFLSLDGDDNQVCGYMGAISVQKGAKLIVESSTFVGNLGGALCTNGEVNISDCLFQGNNGFEAGAGTRPSGVAFSRGEGGAIRGVDAPLRIKGTTFTENSAVMGGAVAMRSSGSGSLYIEGCNFTKNYATMGGAVGAKYQLGPGNNLVEKHLRMHNTSIYGNQGVQGSAVYIQSQPCLLCAKALLVEIMDTFMGNNKATDGTIYAELGHFETLQLDHVAVHDNTASNRGGAVSAALGQESKVVLNQSNIDNNRCVNALPAKCSNIAFRSVSAWHCKCFFQLGRRAYGSKQVTVLGQAAN
jgi:hypothetical protein